MNIISTIYAQTGDGTGCNKTAEYVPLNNIATLITRGAGILVPAGMLVFFVMLLVGGFKYVTSGGDMKSLDSAKGTLTFAFVGIAFLIASWLILSLIGNSILLDGAGGDYNVFDFKLDEIIKTLAPPDPNDPSKFNPCLIGPTVN